MEAALLYNGELKVIRPTEVGHSQRCGWRDTQGPDYKKLSKDI